jgi:hypothetical protein
MLPEMHRILPIPIYPRISSRAPEKSGVRNVRAVCTPAVRRL